MISDSIKNTILQWLCGWLAAFLLAQPLWAQSPTCQTATALCDNISPYPATTDEPDAPFGNDYGCLGTQPNPAWFYFTISQSGTISLPLQNAAVVDVDFILYGPFPSVGAALNQCGNLGNGGPGGNIVDCSYDPQAFEVIDINSAVTGQVYVLLVTNFSNANTSIYTLPNTGTGRIACPCRINTHHSLTPVANNRGSLISTVDSAAQYGACAGDTLFFTVGMHAGNILDSLSLDPATTTINNAFASNEYALFGPFYPIPGRFDTMEIVVGIYPGANLSGVRNFNLGISSLNRGTRIVCPEIAPVSIIIPGMTASDTLACSGENLQLRATSMPTTAMGSSNFSWTQLAGPSVALSNANTATPTANIPAQLSTSSGSPMVFAVQNTYGNCVLRDTVTVTFPDVSLNLAPNPMGTCAGSTAQLFARLSDTLDFTNACLPSYNLSAIPFAPLAGSGTAVTLADDQMSAALPIGFPFRFYCNSYTNFYISSNGFITFNAGQQPAGTNVAIPNNAQPNNLIALAWDDLNPSAGSGAIQYFTAGTAPNRRLVVSFNNVRYYALFGTTRAVTAQLVLHETTNIIEMHVTRIDNNSSDMTMGIENASGNSGMFIAGRNNASFSSSNEGFRFTPVPGPAIPTSPTYSWSPAATLSNSTIFNPIATPAGNTLYTVTVTDGACRYSGDVTVVTASMGVGATVAQPSCATTNSGSIITNANGSVAPLQYLWSNGRTSPNLTGISAGTFTVTVTDVNGCTGTTSATVVAATVPTFSTSINNVTCSGNGAINLTVNTGNAPYTFLWSNGATTEDVSGLNAGLYQVSITDINGCTAVSSLLQVSASSATVRANIVGLQNVTCAGTNNGFVNVNIVGGTAPYTFVWSNGATSQNISGLAAGNYRLTVTDANGCSGTSPSVLLIAPTPINLALVTVVQPSCNGASTGSITVSNSGGTSPYGYSWSNGPNTQNNPNIPAGTYSLTLTDANGCTATLQNITVGQPSAITVSTTSITNVSCANGANGSISVAATGGTGGAFSFVWSNGGSTTSTHTGLTAGVYAVTAVSANGCTGTLANITVTQPASATITAAPIVNTSCAGGNDGSIATSMAGGTAPFAYRWSNGQTSATATGLVAGVYAVTTTDANGCTVSLANISVSQPAAISISVASITAASCGSNNGAIDITPSSGIAPYRFAWSNNATTEDISALAVGSYTVTVTDNNNCTATRTVNVSNTSTLTATLNAITNVSCNGGSNGAVSLQVSGGAAPVTFAWSNSATTQNIAALVPNSYQVTITDGLGCATILGPFAVTQPSALSVTANSIAARCNGSSNGSISLSPAGGTPNYTYRWSTGATTQNLTAVSAGTYAATTTDANGCQLVVTGISVGEPSAVSLSLAAANNPACIGVNNGSIDINVAGGTAPYAFVWSNGQTTEDINNLSAGAYAVTLTDANGCALSLAAATLTSNAVVTITLSSSANASCFGNSDGQLAVQAQGGTPNYAYIWNNSAMGASISGLAAGTYAVTATDALGCVGALGSLAIQEPSALVVTVDALVGILPCDGSQIGNLQAIVSGGVAAYSYAWSNGRSTDTNSNLAAGLYTVTATDANGCVASASGQVIAPAVPSLAAYIDRVGTRDTCIALGYSAQLNAGVTTNDSYSWADINGNSAAGIATPNNAIATIQPTAAGDYVLLVISTKTTGNITCAVTDTVRLCVEELVFGGLPTGFTPNGDGENDRYRPVGLSAQYIQSFSIFNRWGQELYSDANLSDGGWDGTWKGADQPREVYIVILTYQLPQQAEPVRVRGEFTLLR